MKKGTHDMDTNAIWNALATDGHARAVLTELEANVRLQLNSEAAEEGVSLKINTLRNSWDARVLPVTLDISLRKFAA
jgi:hypothetical protein